MVAGIATGRPDGGVNIANWPYLIQDILLGGVVVFSLSIAIIAAMSYRRTKNPKIFKITISFCLFFLKGIVLTITLFSGLFKITGNAVYVMDVALLIDMFILVALYLSIFKK